MGVRRCRKCTLDAVIDMRRHGLSLCGAHFIEWVEKTALKFIGRHRMFEPDDRILVAVSGGKDSLSLWRILLNLGFRADGLYLDLGIDAECGYSRRSGEFAKKFAQEVPEGTELHILDLAGVCGRSITEIGDRIPGGKQKLCSICGLVKRHEMNRVARELGYTVIATGHNLDDEAAVLLGNVLRWETEYLVRQSPVLPSDAPGLVKKVKPLAGFYERETAAYAIVSDIDYIMDECPFSVGAKSIRLKEVLNSIERESPGTKQQFYSEFLKVSRKGLFPGSDPPVLHPCGKCGQATTASDLCSFCRLMERVSRS